MRIEREVKIEEKGREPKWRK